MNRYNSDIQLKPLTVQKIRGLMYRYSKKGNSTCSLWDQGIIGFRGKSETRVWNEVECST